MILGFTRKLEGMISFISFNKTYPILSIHTKHTIFLKQPLPSEGVTLNSSIMIGQYRTF